MDIDDFIGKFSELFDDAENMHFNETTRFKESDEWCSLISLLIISMADEEYHVNLKGEDIQNADTIEDLYQVVRDKM